MASSISSFVFLDTNVFIDAYNNPELFRKEFDNLKDNGHVLLTLNTVALEFLKGSRSIQEYKKKQEFMNNIIEMIFSFTKDAEDMALKLAIIFQSPGGNTAITDFYLGAILMKFQSLGSSCVLTKNHKDFPTTIFDRLSLLTIQGEKDVQVFGYYKFNRSKYSEILEKIL